MLPACKNWYYLCAADAVCVYICVGVYVYVVMVYHPGRAEKQQHPWNSQMEICVCLYMCGDYRVPFSPCCHPIWLFHQILKQFSLMNRWNPYAHMWSLTYHTYNQALTHGKFLCGAPTIPHPSLMLLPSFISLTPFLFPYWAKTLFIFLTSEEERYDSWQ